MQIVYNGVSLTHLLSDEVDAQVHVWNNTGELISDNAAQTIAAWWHSPGNESALLSTQGKVSASITIRDFASQEEYESEYRTEIERLELDALEAYINAKKADAGMKYCDSCEEWKFWEHTVSSILCPDCVEMEEDET